MQRVNKLPSIKIIFLQRIVFCLIINFLLNKVNISNTHIAYCLAFLLGQQAGKLLVLRYFERPALRANFERSLRGL